MTNVKSFSIKFMYWNLVHFNMSCTAAGKFCQLCLIWIQVITATSPERRQQKRRHVKTATTKTATVQVKTVTTISQNGDSHLSQNGDRH